MLLPDDLLHRWDAGAGPFRFGHAPDVEGRLALGDVTSDAFSVHVVPFVDGQLVVNRSSHGHWEMPGGRLERGETAEAAAARELLEEAGFAVDGPVHWFATLWFRRPDEPVEVPAGAWRAIRIGWCDGRIVGPPTNPPDDVATAEVYCGDLVGACERLDRSDRPELILCYETAQLLRQGLPSVPGPG